MPLTRDTKLNENEIKEIVEKKPVDIKNESLTSDENKIFTILVINPSITAEEISKLSDFSLRKVYRTYNSLKEKGYIERIGSDKIGKWQIIKK